ncbi:cell wall hydrolase [Erythrobacter sp. THAF29]|uniref:cell wall hydrolase n=1 Tax=Erythrobacter sp. THAF29 TaxID=2587851 RepID=UPI001268A9ED|nr:cell wall hydrolase [Erythrobacter sp. THAF29]QFT76382.1 Spore cortex-lytic enzyme precursor [Erythrobacter sp. THAF29]
MSRKTYSLSALAIVATAGLSFSSADGAGAFAQEAATLPAATETETTAEELVEIVPEPTVFVSEEVVQPVPEEAAADETSEINAGSLREQVRELDAPEQLSEQMRCLAGAIYFESRGEPLAGQLAVAQVVINRADDRRWPASYCGVVYQRAQFSFVKNGRMPRIRTGSAAWDRAKTIARIAHEGMWESEAADAVYFHAKYVRPKWSRRKTRLAEIDTHIFYR